uniref:Uncharacterized protein n=1 Tax=Arundo donax TaxID=35708 RepID=A0A0A8Y778_ARUDO
MLRITIFFLRFNYEICLVSHDLSHKRSLQHSPDIVLPNLNRWHPSS